MEAFIGTILPVAFNYAPRGWLFCNGQTLPINQYQALFALVSFTYGGDGSTTFGVPDLRGRTLVGSQGQGPGLTNITQGQKLGTNNVTVVSTGVANVTLTAANLPAHSHTVGASTIVLKIPVNDENPSVAGSANTGSTETPGPTTVLSVGTIKIGTQPAMAIKQYTASPATTNLSPINLSVPASTTSNTGAGAPLTIPVSTAAEISVMQPSIGMNFIICFDGIYPNRN